MRELWRRLEGWFGTHFAERSLALRAGASEAAIATAEAELGVRFPDDFRESLRVHDGQEDDPSILWLPGAHRLGSLASLTRCWQLDREGYEPDPQRLEWLDKRQAVRQAHFHAKQIPIAGSPYWDYDRLLLDFIPGPKGREGQVIVRQDIELALLCPTFRELLERTVEGLEKGSIVGQARSAELGGEIELQYLSPRSKKPISFFKYLA